MTRWKKDAKSFTVTVNILKSGSGGESKMCVIPKPVLEKLNDPKNVKFSFTGSKITFTDGDKK